MACGIALKRPLELDSYMSPEGVKRPRTASHCSPFRPACTVAQSPSSTQQQQQSTDSVVTSSEVSRAFSPFGSVTARLNPEQLESYLRAEIKYLERRKLIPRRNGGFVKKEVGTSSGYRAPSSPNSSDSDGEGSMGKSTSKPYRETEEKPRFTFKQVQMICDRLLKEQEARLRSDYESILSTKLSEQYDTFVKFTQDQIHRHIDSGTASYLS